MGFFSSLFRSRDKPSDRMSGSGYTFFMGGSTSGKPLGVLAATGGAETGVTSASSTAITADELMDLFYSLKSPYRKKAVWVLNDSTIKAVRKLKDSTGQYLWQPSPDGRYAGYPAW